MPRFKMYYQREQEDCGAACLVMILCFYGIQQGLDSIKALCGNLKNGMTLYRLKLIAEKIGFNTQAVKVNITEFTVLPQKILPFICHWKQNHFIVVYRMTPKFVYVADPAMGKVKYHYEEFYENFAVSENKEGFALFLKPEKLILPSYIESNREKVNLKKYIKPYWLKIVWVTFSIICISGIGLVFPFLSQAIIDKGIALKNTNLLVTILCATISLVVGRTLFTFLQSRMTLVAGTLINIDVTRSLLQKLSCLPMFFFASRKIGDIIQRVSDVSRIGDYFSSRLVDSVLSVILFCVYGVVLFHLHSVLFFVYISGTLFYLGYNSMFLRRRKILDYESFSAASKTNDELIQFLRGMTELKLAGAERQRLDKWQKYCYESFLVTRKSLSLSQAQTLGSVLAMEVTVSIIMFLMAMAVINGETTLGAMMAIQYIVGSMESPLHKIIRFIDDTQRMKIGLERINYVTSTNPEKKGGLTVGSDNGVYSMQIDGIFFSYDLETSTPTLNNICVDIPAGHTTALVGMSGSGKTTFIKLLLGFYVPNQGSICVNGISLSDIDLSSWRKSVGVVMQDGYIFSDTIVHNVALGDPNPKAEQVREALRIACADFVFKLPSGMNTIIGAEGFSLSVGQRQRLLLARAIYKKPGIFFLDEATNSLDAINERNIYNNLQKALKGKTVIVAAHRLSTIKDAHQILVFDKGVIVEKGTHESLLLNNGKYSELIKNQLDK